LSGMVFSKSMKLALLSHSQLMDLKCKFYFSHYQEPK
jgi:hypothetical protein